MNPISDNPERDVFFNPMDVEPNSLDTILESLSPCLRTLLEKSSDLERYVTNWSSNSPVDFKIWKAELPDGSEISGSIRELALINSLDSGLSHAPNKGIKVQVRMNIGEAVRQLEDPNYFLMLAARCFGEILFTGDHETTVDQYSRVTSMICTNNASILNLPPQTDLTSEGMTAVLDLVNSKKDEIAEIYTLIQQVRGTLAPVLADRGRHAIAEAEQLRDKLDDEGKELWDTAFHTLFLFGAVRAEEHGAFMEKLSGGKDYVRTQITQELLGEDPARNKSLSREIKQVVGFVTQLVSNGIVDSNDQRLHKVITTTSPLSELIERLTEERLESNNDLFIEWFGKVKSKFPDILWPQSPLSDEIKKIEKMSNASKAYKNYVSAAKPVVTARRAKKRANAARIEAMDNVSLSPEVTEEPKTIGTITLLPNGGWRKSKGYDDTDSFIENHFSKPLRQADATLKADISKMIDYLRLQADKADCKALLRFITKPNTGKPVPIYELKRAALQGVAGASTPDSYRWRVVFVVDEGVPYVLDVHHRDDQDRVLSKYRI